MKKLIITCSLLMGIATLNAQPSDFPKLTGPYLGQKPPGITPEIFAPGIVSKEGMQGKLYITPDGSEIIFMSMVIIPVQGDNPANRKIFFESIKMINGIWDRPEIIPFSTEYTNDEPALSYDGKMLFFVSNRPSKGKTEPQRMPDIWMAERIGEKWSAPVNVGFPVNTDSVEVQPYYSNDNKLYFARKDGLYCSKYENGKYLSPFKLDEGIFKGRLSGICISPDSKTLIVHSSNPGGQGSWDLYASFQDKEANWGQLINLGNVINTNQSEGNATFSPDGKYLFFTRGSDIYWVSAKIIEDLRPKE